MPDAITCLDCGGRVMELVTGPYAADITHDGRTYRVALPAVRSYRCPTCPESVVIPDETDRLIGAELRRVAGLLPPEQIRAGRVARGLSEREFADALGVAEATLARWEAGTQVQQRAFDKLLRLYFDVPEARAYLAGAAVAGALTPAPTLPHDSLSPVA